MNHSNDNGGSIQLLDKMHYPRTGKRGVPQQFPRRLYEMLEAETVSVSSSSSLTSSSSSSSSSTPNDDDKGDPIVHWSTSGLAFRIEDVTLFSKSILPKYFKTSKFSSFQRNLNLVSNQVMMSLQHPWPSIQAASLKTASVDPFIAISMASLRFEKVLT